MGRHGSSQRQHQGTLHKTVSLIVILLSSLATNYSDSQTLGQSGSGTRKNETFVDGIIAVVNNTPLLHSKVKEKVVEGSVNILVDTYPATNDSSNLEKALQDEINLTLIRDAAEKLGLSTSDEEITKRLELIREQNQLTEEQLQSFLRAQGKSLEDYRGFIEKQVMVQKFYGRVLIPQIKITDKDLQTFYQRTQGNVSDQVDVVVRQILVKASNKNSSERTAKEARINEAYRKLKAGQAFIDVEKIYSDLDDAREGLQAKSYRLKDLRAEFYGALKRLKDGEITPIIKTEMGYHIFLLQSRNTLNTEDFQKKKSKLENALRMRERTRVLEQWLKNQRMKAHIKIYRSF